MSLLASKTDDAGARLLYGKFRTQLKQDKEALPVASSALNAVLGSVRPALAGPFLLSAGADLLAGLQVSWRALHMFISCCMLTHLRQPPIQVLLTADWLVHTYVLRRHKAPAPPVELMSRRLDGLCWTA